MFMVQISYTLLVWKHNGDALLLLCIRVASAPLKFAVWNGRMTSQYRESRSKA